MSNISKYIFESSKIGEDDKSFNTCVKLLNDDKIVDDKKTIHKFYLAYKKINFSKTIWDLNGGMDGWRNGHKHSTRYVWVKEQDPLSSSINKYKDPILVDTKSKEYFEIGTDYFGPITSVQSKMMSHYLEIAYDIPDELGDLMFEINKKMHK